MEEYKPNSHRSREEQKSPAPPEKKEKVVSGSTRTKRKGEMQKFAGALISDDISDAKSRIVMELIVPAVKDTIIEAVKILLWGENGYNRKGAASASRINYGSFSRDNDRRRDRGPGTTRAGSGLDYDNILFDNRGDAEAVLSAMDDQIEQFDVVSVGDMYEFADVSTTNYMVHRIGWYDIRSAQVVRVRDGYMIKLPKAQIIK